MRARASVLIYNQHAESTQSPITVNRLSDQLVISLEHFRIRSVSISGSAHMIQIYSMDV